MANKIDEFDKSVTNVNTQIKDVEGGLKKNWTEVVKGTIKEVKSTTVALNNVVKSIKNNVETINRECNVVLFRLSEAETNSADAHNDDKKIVTNLLSVITNDEIKESDIKKMYRIGKKGDNPRPIMIEFKEKSMKNMTMENRVRMKQLSDELKNVSISHDFTKEQREKCKKLHTSFDCASMVFNSSGNVNKIKMGLLNIRYLGLNVDDVHGLLNDDFDVLMLTETWHKSSDNICLSLAKPRDFSFSEQVRLNDPEHGGLVTYFRNHFKCVKIPLPVIITFEAICFKLTLRKTSVIFLVIYRPGSAPPAKLFFEELILVLEQITLLCCSIVVAGDFNIHVETSSDIYATALADIFSSFDLVNRINQSTHVLGGTLDLIVTSDGFLLEDGIYSVSGIYSDHGLVTGQFLINPTPVIFKKSWIRSWKRVDKKRLTELLRCSPISKHYVLTEEQISKGVNSSPTKSCSLDPIPTHVFK
ncbi:hypothetical protein HELRODRAFT_178192 [Helobdella robusta]|uniref:Endonuclease/exonuclease/phosphatase domain-containing protein n=1 Tax=Helobdella robusta TaxID=6412 RepID=T1FCX1_HELRO|nr:hypothetical protein HELRODRAFT_178192 [Helobdella robusta]ESN97401.1 hypothetical protein HELRODRAFT_178192 [Helobdella robusta]